jgi:coenzyme F420-0:L-glutamate ligase/coenzyme F420-1:gamma-L-glutamate ligase
MELRVWAPDTIGEITHGTDLGELIVTHLPDLADGDIVCVTSKIVSKAEGQILTATDREDAITSETVRLVAKRTRPDGPPLRIVENHLGLVMAAAGVDASNTADGTILLLPRDPDASAARMRAAVRERLGVNVGVVISDTAGRPWRAGLTEIAIGCAGLTPLEDYRGASDMAGRELSVSVTAVADELVNAAELAKGKLGGRPLAVVRGRGDLVLPIGDDGAGARSLVRLGESDLFSMGTAEAIEFGRSLGSADSSDA